MSPACRIFDVRDPRWASVNPPTANGPRTYLHAGTGRFPYLFPLHYVPCKRYQLARHGPQLARADDFLFLEIVVIPRARRTFAMLAAALCIHATTIKKTSSAKDLRCITKNHSP